MVTVEAEASVISADAVSESNCVRQPFSCSDGGLVTDKPDSPHLQIPKIKAEVLCCVADNDDKSDPAAKDKLKEGLRGGSPEGYRRGFRWLQPRVDRSWQPSL